MAYRDGDKTRVAPDPGRALSAFLNIDKPAGVTSMDVVRRIKRASRQKRVGHGGTLDPAATGVVPVCLGWATRMMRYVVDETKEYRGKVELGVETDTYDSEGTVTRRSDPSHLARTDVEKVLDSFQGTVSQVPPMFSALKKRGKRLYDLARAGIEVEREPRQVQVFGIELREWSPPFVELEMSCGRGYYMRSLAHDLGQALGCGGHLSALVRLRSGPFTIADAVSLDEAEERFEDGTWRDLLYAPDIVVRHLRAAVVGRRIEAMIANGRSLSPGMGVPSADADERCRVYSTGGSFLAVMVFDGSAGRWQPESVFIP